MRFQTRMLMAYTNIAILLKLTQPIIDFNCLTEDQCWQCAMSYIIYIEGLFASLLIRNPKYGPRQSK